MNTIEQAIRDIAEGKFVIVVDDEDRAATRSVERRVGKESR